MSILPKLSTMSTAILFILVSPASHAGKAPSQEEMWRLIQQQQRQIESLRKQLQNTDAKAETAVEAVESGRPAASAKAGWAERTHIGGYGELHYNNLSGEGSVSDKREIDMHRFVLFVGHEFNDRLRFFSELEVEHVLAGDGEPGEVELEQAYIEADITDAMRARAGVFLLPVGIINETHEPPTFYGVERNPVEHDIIPATWWAAGLALAGEFGAGWHYDLAIHEGLQASGPSYQPRGGRQESAKAVAENLAYTARLKWTGITGLELAGSLHYQSDITQGNDPDAGGAWLYEAHAIYQRGPFGLKALYARWNLDGAGPEAVGADRQDGGYIEPSWKLNDGFGLFTRYNVWDNAAGNGVASRKSQWNVGLNWWLDPDVVVKLDYQYQDNDDGIEHNGVNLGVGFQF